MRTSGSSGTIKDDIFDFGFVVVTFVDGAVVVCTVVIEFLIQITICYETKLLTAVASINSGIRSCSIKSVPDSKSSKTSSISELKLKFSSKFSSTALVGIIFLGVSGIKSTGTCSTES
jgi:hypothetical protein